MRTPFANTPLLFGSIRMNAAGNGKTYGKTGQNNRDIHFNHIIHCPFFFLNLNRVRQLDRLPECPLLSASSEENRGAG